VGAPVAADTEQVGELIVEHGLSFAVQPLELRTFSDAELQEVGAEIGEDLSGCPVVLGIKEMPESVFQSGHTLSSSPMPSRPAPQHADAQAHDGAGLFFD
jgi:hypothetical protein